MKTKISYSLVAAAMACGIAHGAATAYTTPVGYITSTVAGNTTNDPAGYDTFISPSLVNPATFAGQTTVAPSGTTATFSGSVPTNLDNSYIVEITAGADEGWWSKVSSSTATTIVTTNAFPITAGTNVKMTVRKLTTINQFLGENTIGLTGNDSVLVLDPAAQAVSFIIYTAGEWQNFVTEVNEDDRPILPGTSIVIRRFGVSGLSLVSSGEVKTTKTEVDIFPQDNWLGQPLATGGTLGSMNFKSEILPSDSLRILAPDQVSSFYVSVGNEMQNFVTEANADNVPIAQGAGYVISRPSGPGSAIVIPAQVVAP